MLEMILTIIQVILCLIIMALGYKNRDAVSMAADYVS